MTEDHWIAIEVLGVAERDGREVASIVVSNSLGTAEMILVDVEDLQEAVDA